MPASRTRAVKVAETPRPVAESGRATEPSPAKTIKPFASRDGAGGDSAVSNFIFPTYKALQPYQNAAADILAPLAQYNPDRAHQLISAAEQAVTIVAGKERQIGL